MIHFSRNNRSALELQARGRWASIEEASICGILIFRRSPRRPSACRQRRLRKALEAAQVRAAAAAPPALRDRKGPVQVVPVPATPAPAVPVPACPIPVREVAMSRARRHRAGGPKASRRGLIRCAAPDKRRGRAGPPLKAIVLRCAILRARPTAVQAAGPARRRRVVDRTCRDRGASRTAARAGRDRRSPPDGGMRKVNRVALGTTRPRRVRR